MERRNSLYERMKDWWENTHLTIGYNREEDTEFQFQPGGTAIFSINEVLSRVFQSGHDESGMGRWSWVRLRKKHILENNSCVQTMLQLKPDNGHNDSVRVTDPDPELQRR